MDENILRVTIRAPRCGNRAEWCGMEADAIGFVRVLSRRDRCDGTIRCGCGWGGSFWGVDSVAFRAARQASAARGFIRAGEFAREFGGRVAHHSHGLRRGRNLYPDVAEFAGAVEEVLWIQAARIVS